MEIARMNRPGKWTIGNEIRRYTFDFIIVSRYWYWYTSCRRVSLYYFSWLRQLPGHFIFKVWPIYIVWKNITCYPRYSRQEIAMPANLVPEDLTVIYVICCGRQGEYKSTLPHSGMSSLVGTFAELKGISFCLVDIPGAEFKQYRNARIYIFP